MMWKVMLMRCMEEEPEVLGELLVEWEKYYMETGLFDSGCGGVGGV